MTNRVFDDRDIEVELEKPTRQESDVHISGDEADLGMMKMTKQSSVLVGSPEDYSNPCSRLFLSWITPLFKIAQERQLEAEDLHYLTDQDSSLRLEREFNMVWEEVLEERLPENYYEQKKIEDKAFKDKNQAIEDEDKRLAEEKKEAEARGETWTAPLQPRKKFPWCCCRHKKRTKASDDLQLWVPKLLHRAICRKYCCQLVTLCIVAVFTGLLGFVLPLIMQRFFDWINDPTSSSWTGIKYSLIIWGSLVFQFLLNEQMLLHLVRIGMQCRIGLIMLIFKKMFRMSPNAVKETSAGKIVNLATNDAGILYMAVTMLGYAVSGPVTTIISFYLLYKYLGPSIFVGIGLVIFVLYPATSWMGKVIVRMHKNLSAMRDARLGTTTEVFNAINIVKMYAWESKFGEKIQELRQKELKQLRSILFFNAFLGTFYGFFPIALVAATFVSFSLMGGEMTPSVAFISISLFDMVQMPLLMFPWALTMMMWSNVGLRRIQKHLLGEQTEVSVEQTAGAKQECYQENATFYWDDLRTVKALDNVSWRAIHGSRTMVVGRVGSGKSALLKSVFTNMNKAEGTTVQSYKLMSYCDQSPWIQNDTIKSAILKFSGLHPDRLTVKEETWYDRVVEACGLNADFDLFAAGDRTEIGEKGITLSGGQKQRIALARAVFPFQNSMGNTIFIFDAPLSAVDPEQAGHIYGQVMNNLLKGATVLMATNNTSLLSNEPRSVIYIDEGRVVLQGTADEVRDAGFVVEEKGSASEDEETKKRKEEEKARKKKELEEKRKKVKLERAKMQSKAGLDGKKKKEVGRLIEDENRKKGRVAWNDYKAYFLAGGGLIGFCGLLFFAILSQSSGQLSRFVVAEWSDATIADPTESQARWIIIYLSLALGFLILAVPLELITARIAIRAATVFHAGLIENLLTVPQRFFDTTPIGRVLNRFTQDLGKTDQVVPKALTTTISMFIGLCVSVGILIYITPWFALCMFPIFFFFFMQGVMYLKGSRELKRWTAVRGSPIFSHISESWGGLDTIRAFNHEEGFYQKMKKLLDLETQPKWAEAVAVRWFSMRVSAEGSFLYLICCFLAVMAKDRLSAGMLGLVLTSAMGFTKIMQWMMLQATALEEAIVSVERLNEFIDEPKEAPRHIEATKPPTSWPQHGAVSIKNLQLRYRPELDLVLKGLNLEIKAGEKLGICGRSGSGKSTLLLALLRIVEPESSSRIEIDGVNIVDLGLHDLRSRMAIIPQTPTMFEGTVKFNVDPFEQYSDEEIWRALKCSYIDERVRGLPEKLEHAVEKNGANFSVGERQLFCLARAILRNTKILLLDEATASVDGETDLLVQKAIRENFCDSTVLTIAHRINTIMESDRILLIEEGELAELDSPQNLVETDSKFAQLVRHHYGLDPKEVYEAHLERLSKNPTAIATSVGDLDVAERRDSCRVLTLDVEEEAKERERQVSVV